LDRVQFVEGTHTSSSIDAGLMSTATNILEFEEMCLLYAIWHIVVPRRVQGWLVGGSS
jgi:hypothetical protein